MPGEISDNVEAVRATESVADSIGVDTVTEAKADAYLVTPELLSWLCELELVTCAGATFLDALDCALTAVVSSS